MAVTIFFDWELTLELVQKLQWAEFDCTWILFINSTISKVQYRAILSIEIGNCGYINVIVNWSVNYISFRGIRTINFNLNKMILKILLNNWKRNHCQDSKNQSNSCTITNVNCFGSSRDAEKSSTTNSKPTLIYPITSLIGDLTLIETQCTILHQYSSNCPKITYQKTIQRWQQEH